MHLGDADAEVKRLMGESADLNSAQQEAEAHLSQSKQTIQELQAALKAAQVTGHVCLPNLSQFSHASPPPTPCPPTPWRMALVCVGLYCSVKVSCNAPPPPKEAEPFHEDCIFSVM